MATQVREETVHWYRENSPPSISPVEYQVDAKVNAVDSEPNQIIQFVGRYQNFL